METYPMVAKTFQGLEDVLCEELLSLGARNVETGQRMVSFEGDLEMMYKANLCCRTALRILKPIIKFTATDPDDLYDQVRDIEWEKYMSPDTTFAIDSTVSSADFTHSRFVTYRVKDGIADHFNDRCGRRPSIRLNGADVLLNVHIFENRVTISLDSTGEPLSHRGYKVAQTDAPINEVLAAGIILKTGWRGDVDFADPMCGSGTFLIEAALIAANINPGIYREHFAFETWPDFDRELFETLYNDDSEERTPTCRIMGGDIDPEAVGIARRNIKNAKIEEYVTLQCKPMAEWRENGDDGVLVTNPPYGERLRPDSMETLYSSIGSTLKTEFQGWHAWIIGYKDEHFASIGLKPSVKIPLHNGSLECSLREYVMFNGSYSDFRADGNDIGNKGRRHEGEKKIHRMSDREWEEESRRFDGGRKGRGPAKDFKKKRDFRRDDDRRDDRQRDDDRRDFRKGDRKDFRRDDRRRDDDRADFRKGDRKEFRRDDDRRDFRKDNRKDFRRDDDRRDFRKGDRKEFRRTERPARVPVDKGPSLPEESTYRYSEYKMRSRKRSYRDSRNGEDAED